MPFKTCPLVRIGPKMNNVPSSCAYVMLMLWVFSLAYASVCAYAYAYVPVKTSLYVSAINIH